MTVTTLSKHIIPPVNNCRTAYLWDCQVDMILGHSTPERQLLPPFVMMMSVSLMRELNLLKHSAPLAA